MRRLRIGDLREWITFQVVTRAVVTPGGITETWSNLTKAPRVAAHFEPGVGREFPNANQIEGEDIGTFSIRQRRDLNRATMRIVFNSANWNIQSIYHDPGRMWTYVLASQVK